MASEPVEIPHHTYEAMLPELKKSLQSLTIAGALLNDELIARMETINKGRSSMQKISAPHEVQDLINKLLEVQGRIRSVTKEVYARAYLDAS